MDDNINTTYYDSTVPRIDPQIKKEWVGWLRSEKYQGKQGREALQTADGKFCCLGVYCEEAGVPKFTKQHDVHFRDNIYKPVDFIYYGDELLHSKGLIPASFPIPFVASQNLDMVNWGGGFRGHENIFTATRQGFETAPDGGYIGFTLPHLNDDGFTFDQIADIINYFL